MPGGMAGGEARFQSWIHSLLVGKFIAMIRFASSRQKATAGCYAVPQLGAINFKQGTLRLGVWVAACCALLLGSGSVVVSRRIVLRNRDDDRVYRWRIVPELDVQARVAWVRNAQRRGDETRRNRRRVFEV